MAHLHLCSHEALLCLPGGRGLGERWCLCTPKPDAAQQGGGPQGAAPWESCSVPTGAQRVAMAAPQAVSSCATDLTRLPGNPRTTSCPLPDPDGVGRGPACGKSPRFRLRAQCSTPAALCLSCQGDGMAQGELSGRLPGPQEWLPEARRERGPHRAPALPGAVDWLAGLEVCVRGTLSLTWENQHSRRRVCPGVCVFLPEDAAGQREAGGVVVSECAQPAAGAGPRRPQELRL